MTKHFTIYIIALMIFGLNIAPIAAEEDDTERSTNSETARPSKSPRPTSDVNTNRGKIDDMKSMRSEQLKTIETKKSELKTMQGEMRSAIASARAEMKAKLCERVDEHIDSVTSRYENNHKAHALQYQKLKTKVQEMITKLKSQGLNTTGIEATLPTLDTKIKTVETQHALYIKELQELKALNCNNTEDQLKTAREEARTQLAKVRAAVEDVRTYYKTAVREELIKLKAQRASASPKASASVVASPTAQ